MSAEKTGAGYARGQSKQDYETPREFVDAVEDLIGERFVWDLAADHSNAVAATYFTAEDDSLSKEWSNLDGPLWLNPPYAKIDPWARKAAACGVRTAMLVPASVGSLWYRDHVHFAAHALPVFLRPRIRFVGTSQGYPRDLMVVFYYFPINTFPVAPGAGRVALWDWKGKDGIE